MRIVLAHGVFDLMHVGHLNHLMDARGFGDYLVVSVVPEKFATKRQPIYSDAARIRLLENLRCVDRAVLCDGPGPELVIERIRPDVYVRGDDYRGIKMPESDLLERLGIPVMYTDAPSDSTGRIIGQIRAQYTESL